MQACFYAWLPVFNIASSTDSVFSEQFQVHSGKEQRAQRSRLHAPAHNNHKSSNVSPSSLNAPPPTLAKHRPFPRHQDDAENVLSPTMKERMSSWERPAVTMSDGGH